MGDVAVYVMIILKWILHKQNARLWTGFIWLIIAPTGELLRTQYQTWGSINAVIYQLIENYGLWDQLQLDYFNAPVFRDVLDSLSASERSAGECRLHPIGRLSR